MHDNSTYIDIQVKIKLTGGIPAGNLTPFMTVIVNVTYPLMLQ